MKAGGRLMRKRFFLRGFIQAPSSFAAPIILGCGCPCAYPEFSSSKAYAIESLEEYEQILKEEMSEVERRIQELRKKGD